MKFTDLSLIPPLLQAVTEAGYTQPSPIQEKAIPPVLAGRDLLGCAQTGTGKTAAFALPILQLLAARKPPAGRPIRSLILTPTRELALQIQESFEIYGKHLPLRSAVIFGGVGQAPQVAQLKKGVDILVATPGRLNDLIGQGYVKLAEVEIFVLDEADRMLDMGFVQDVKKVLKFLPEKKQTLLFSATMPDEIIHLADSLLHKPAKVFVTPVSSTVEKIDQSLYRVDKANKRRLLADLLRDKSVTSALVFTRTKHGADRVARELGRDGIKAMAIHGNKSQNARQDALARFKDGRVRVLIATDIAARGLDIAELSHVFNYDLPNVPETYVHRIGRTGRAGHGGTAVSFCCYDELDCLKDIEKLIGFKVPEVTAHNWPMQVFEKHVPAQNAQQGRAARRPAEKPAEKAPKAPTGKNAKKGAKPLKENQQAPAGKPAKAPAKQPGTAPKARTGGPRNQLPDPYSEVRGGKAIVTKRPVWSTLPDVAPPAKKPEHAPVARGGPADKTDGGDTMARNNNRRRGKGRGGQQNQPNAQKKADDKPKVPEIKKNENGIFNFSDEELAADDSLQLIRRDGSDTKFSSFEDFIKNH